MQPLIRYATVKQIRWGTKCSEVILADFLLWLSLLFVHKCSRM